MPEKHEPDPRFLDQLEGRISSELRNRRLPSTRTRPRTNMPWVVLGSALFGAAVTGATFQAGENWRYELVETRLEAQLEMAEGRAAARQEVARDVYARMEAGVLTRATANQIWRSTGDTQVQVLILRSRLEEARTSGVEPDDGITARLVKGVDYVTERLTLREDYARRWMVTAQRSSRQESQRWEAGASKRLQVDLAELTAYKARLELDAVYMRISLRRQYLNDQVAAAHAELLDLRIDARLRARSAMRELGVYRDEVERSAERLRQGVISRVQHAEAEAREAEARALFDLAQRELEIVQDAINDLEAR